MSILADKLLNSKTNKNYAIWLGDTVLVKENEVEVLTKISKKYEEISYSLEVFVFCIDNSHFKPTNC